MEEFGDGWTSEDEYSDGSSMADSSVGTWGSGRSDWGHTDSPSEFWGSDGGGEGYTTDSSPEFFTRRVVFSPAVEVVGRRPDYVEEGAARG